MRFTVINIVIPKVSGFDHHTHSLRYFSCNKNNMLAQDEFHPIITYDNILANHQLKRFINCECHVVFVHIFVVTH